MSTHAKVAVSATRKAVYDKFQAQVHSFEAKVATLRAKAETAKANAELKAIARVAIAIRTLDEKLAKAKAASNAARQSNAR